MLDTLAVINLFSAKSNQDSDPVPSLALESDFPHQIRPFAFQTSERSLHVYGLRAFTLGLDQLESRRS